MKKENVIKENRSFRIIYRKVKPFVANEVIIYAQKSRYNGIRYGITAGKKVGNAVKRNRAKRVIRAAFYNVMKNLDGNWNFIFVARSKTPYFKSTDVERTMLYYFSSIGILKNNCEI